MKKKRRSIKSLANATWKLFSEHVRTKESSPGGLGNCVSCHKAVVWKEAHAGHFIHAGRGGKRNRVSYDERNVHLQCVGCNTYDQSKVSKINYTLYMIKRYGEGIIEELKQIKHEGFLSYDELLEIHERLKP
jgi:hypothetical protein